MSWIDDMLTKVTSTLVGEDENGNKYYESKSLDYLGRPIRKVIYKSSPEPSTITPEWHQWIHHMTREIPVEAKLPWQKAHKANATGGPHAYKASKQRVSSEYQPWQPRG
jgi:NADH:ubiquinone oxidoreductase subunit